MHWISIYVWFLWLCMCVDGILMVVVFQHITFALLPSYVGCSIILSVATLALGSWPKQKGLWRCGPRLSSGVTFSCSPGVQKSVRERTPTLPSELPCWELESWWTPECSESACKDQNAMAQGNLHIIGKLLKCRCLKLAHITHLDIWSTSYGQKKEWESNWQFDSQPLKVKNRPDFIACRWRATYHWKALDERYNFVLDLISIKGLHTKLWGPKVAGILILTISGLPSHLDLTKRHLDMGFMERHIVYLKGEGGGFPQVRAVVSFVSSNCLWLVLAPKVLQLCTNHLVLILCRSVWVVDACHSS